MRIKKRLRLNVAVSVLTALIICLMLILALHRVNRALEASDIADEIIRSTFEKSTFREDYLRTGSERAKAQWFARHEQMAGLLKSAEEKYTDSEDKNTVDEMIKDHESTGNLFSAIVKNREAAGVDPTFAALAQEIENRLLTQMSMRLYDRTLLARRLQAASRGMMIAALRQAGGGIVAVLTIVLAVAVISSWTMTRTIADRVRRLRDGATVIGGGDLEHRIDIKGDDEFVELSEAFNAMTAKLRGSYNALEMEIEERKWAEEQQRLAYGRLQTFFDHRIGGIGIVIANARGGILQTNDYYLDILGFTREEFLSGQVDWRLMTPPEWLPADERALQQLQELGVCDTYEKEYVRRDGSRVPVLITDVMMPGEGGDILAFVLDITERKRAEEQLKASLAEKEVMLREIHHRVKNNLQVISSLVSLQADGSPDETVREVLRDVTYRVRSMALVHEKLYHSDSLSLIDFAEYVRGLFSYLWRAHGAAAATVRLTLDLEPVSLPMDIALPCGLILNELAANALKHAFRGRDEGEVIVSLQGNTGGLVSISVHDNGVGLPPELDWRQAPSLGLQLVQMLAGQLNATVEVSDPGGTEFTVSFKLKTEGLSLEEKQDIPQPSAFVPDFRSNHE